MEPVTTAPEFGCDCAVCQWVRRREAAALGYRFSGTVAAEEDLSANYERYLSGDLVSRDAKE